MLDEYVAAFWKGLHQDVCEHLICKLVAWLGQVLLVVIGTISVGLPVLVLLRWAFTYTEDLSLEVSDELLEVLSAVLLLDWSLCLDRLLGFGVIEGLGLLLALDVLHASDGSVLH